jgi:glycogen debranching enzyme
MNLPSRRCAWLMFIAASAILILIASCAGAVPEPPAPLRIAYLDFTKDASMDRYESIALPEGIDREAVERYRRISAITVAPGERRHYVFGDNISGYWDGLTHSYRRGNGYQIGESVVLAEIASAADGVLLNRRIGAETAVLRPGEITHRYPGFEETMYLFAGEHSMSVEVAAENGPAVISFFPAFTASLSRYEYRVEDGVFLLIPSRLNDEVPAVIAISASVPVMMGEDLASSLGREGGGASLAPLTGSTGTAAGARLTGVSDSEIAAADRDIRNAVKVSDRSPLLSFTSLSPVERAEFFVSFGYDLDDALDRAKRVRSRGRENHLEAILELELSSRIQFPDEQLERALFWSTYSGYTMVTRQYGTGIWAGLPWFRQNWGRDTFIALPGILLTTARFDEARDVLDTFARFQNLDEDDANYGRVPNRVNNPEDIIYNTTDGTPWLIREAEEYLHYSGDTAFAPRILELARHYIDGAMVNFVGEDGLLHHDDADTWMDARIANDLPWSARGDRAVEIQALWYTALRSAASIARLSGEDELAAGWDALADRAKASFEELFWNGEALADRIDAEGVADYKLRPNQLMAISVPYLGDISDGNFIDPAVQAAVTSRSVNGLLYPWGIASLDPEHPYFHPRHDQTGMYHKDAAYHNGTIWGWNAGPALTAMLRFGAADLSAELLASLADQINQLGTLGSMSELIEPLPDDDGNLVPSGTFSQAWSVSEFTRVVYQDLIGFRPRLLDGRVALAPMLPEGVLPAGSTLEARLAYGDGEALELTVRREAGGATEYQIRRADGAGGAAASVLEFSAFRPEAGWFSAEFPLSADELVITVEADGTPVTAGDWRPVFPAFPEMTARLGFRDAAADAQRTYPAMEEPNYLQRIIEAGEFR